MNASWTLYKGDQLNKPTSFLVKCQTTVSSQDSIQFFGTVLKKLGSFVLTVVL